MLWSTSEYLTPSPHPPPPPPSPHPTGPCCACCVLSGSPSIFTSKDHLLFFASSSCCHQPSLPLHPSKPPFSSHYQRTFLPSPPGSSYRLRLPSCTPWRPLPSPGGSEPFLLHLTCPLFRAICLATAATLRARTRARPPSFPHPLSRTPPHTSSLGIVTLRGQIFGTEHLVELRNVADGREEVYLQGCRVWGLGFGA